jgi:hypothetical protein
MVQGPRFLECCKRAEFLVVGGGGGRSEERLPKAVTTAELLDAGTVF